MNGVIKSLVGMGGMTDQVIATDFLISAKAGVRNLAFAVTESATPELKETLRMQLRDTIQIHEDIATYMIAKGFYHPHDLEEQLKVDSKISDTALGLVGQ
jgi:similar to spore coat protein